MLKYFNILEIYYNLISMYKLKYKNKNYYLKNQHYNLILKYIKIFLLDLSNNKKNEYCKIDLGYIKEINTYELKSIVNFDNLII